MTERPSFGITALGPGHDLGTFDCGEPARNAWLRSRALPNQAIDDTRTYAASQDSRVSGLYALTVGSVLRGPLPGPLRQNAPDPVGASCWPSLRLTGPAKGGAWAAC